MTLEMRKAKTPIGRLFSEGFAPVSDCDKVTAQAKSETINNSLPTALADEQPRCENHEERETSLVRASGISFVEQASKNLNLVCGVDFV